MTHHHRPIGLLLLIECRRQPRLRIIEVHHQDLRNPRIGHRHPHPSLIVNASPAVPRNQSRRLQRHHSAIRLHHRSLHLNHAAERRIRNRRNKNILCTRPRRHKPQQHRHYRRSPSPKHPVPPATPPEGYSHHFSSARTRS